MIHVYTTIWQPFTDFWMDDYHFTHKRGDTRFSCHECGDTKRAENLEVQAYYDLWRIRCKCDKHLGWN